jgi:hypothetical protein
MKKLLLFFTWLRNLFNKKKLPERGIVITDGQKVNPPIPYQNVNPFSRYPSMNRNHKNGTRQQSKKNRSTNRKKSK